MATVFSFSGREFGTTYVYVAVAGALAVPLLASFSRQDVLPLELLFPSSRAQFIRGRVLSIATKYACLFAGLLVYVAIVQYFFFHTLNFEYMMRAVVMFACTTIAGTGLDAQELKRLAAIRRPVCDAKQRHVEVFLRKHDEQNGRKRADLWTK